MRKEETLDRHYPKVSTYGNDDNKGPGKTLWMLGTTKAAKDSELVRWLCEMDLRDTASAKPYLAHQFQDNNSFSRL